MNLLIHDIATAIERAASRPPVGHWAYNVMRADDDPTPRDSEPDREERRGTAAQ